MTLSKKVHKELINLQQFHKCLGHLGHDHQSSFV